MGRAIRETSVQAVQSTLSAAAQLAQHLGQKVAYVAAHFDADGLDAQRPHLDLLILKAVDSTGAGDTFAGYVLTCLDRGHMMAQAIKTAMTDAAIVVTRYGTADVIPDLKDIEDFRLSS